MSLSKPAGSKGSIREQERMLAFDLGNMIERAAQDSQGRIELNPIATTLEERLGSPCRLDHFQTYRASLLEKLAESHKKSVEEICLEKGFFGSAGTW